MFDPEKNRKMFKHVDEFADSLSELKGVVLSDADALMYRADEKADYMYKYLKQLAKLDESFRGMFKLAYDAYKFETSDDDWRKWDDIPENPFKKK